MYSYATKNGKVLDWKFKKIKYGYEASLDNKAKLGQIFKFKDYWIAISYVQPKYRVSGFKYRYLAMGYLIKLYDKDN